MNPCLQKLCEIARKETRLIVGLMSGTSLDGLDIALCEVSGAGRATRLNVRNFTTIPYSEAFRTEVRKVFSKKEVDFQQVCILNPYIALLHAGMILDCLAEWGVKPSEVDLIASHGQSVFHAPFYLHQQAGFPNATLQLGDGDHIAVKTGIITISDFRQKHIAAGGEGAPLAAYGDYLLFGDADENRILLNIGGIANFTLLPRHAAAHKVFTTDTGPGNGLMDAFARLFFESAYDEDGKIAARGRVHEELLKQLRKSEFFEMAFPKTTGPELFNPEYLRMAQLRSGATSLMPDDLMATLSRFSAETIAAGIRAAVSPGEGYVIYVSGGGARNRFLVDQITELLPGYTLRPLEVLGFSGDAKEAILFAVLANETVSGQGPEFLDNKAMPPVTMGKISFPS